MFIDKDQNRFNPYAAIVFEGTTYYGSILSFPDIVRAMGIKEIPDPQPPEDFSDDVYFRNYVDYPPYEIFTKKSEDQINAATLRKYETALDNMLDSVAATHRYNDRFTFIARAGYSGPYQAEAINFAQWMDACNVKAYQVMVNVMSGTGEVPADVEAFLDLLPKYKRL